MPKELSNTLRIALKLVITTLIVVYLMWVLQANWHDYKTIMEGLQDTPTLLLLSVLMLFNWGIEALKWQLLASKLEEINFLQSLKAVFVGVSLGMIAPKSVGDCVGRLLFINSFRKIRLLGALLLGQAFQLCVTLLFGLPAAYVYFKRFDSSFSIDFFVGLMIFCFSVGAFFYRRKLLARLFETNLGARLKTYLVVVKEYTSRDIALLLIYSLFRYLIFSLQFVLTLKLIGVSFSFAELFVLVAVVYLIKSMLFSINFVADMGMRQLTAVSVMSAVGIVESQAMLASMGLWTLNLLFPAIIGLFFWLQLKLKWE